MYHYDPATALEELREDAVLPNPVLLCDMILRRNLAPGQATARASAHLPDGSRSGEALCTGTIAPGETARAECAAPP